MQDLITATLFAVILATSPHPVLFVLTTLVLIAALGSRLFFVWHLSHKKGRRYV